MEPLKPDPDASRMNTMTYKGYTAVLEIDQEDGILFGKVIGLRDGITFEADTVPQAIEEFHRSVDFYLEVCAGRGEAPEKPYMESLRPCKKCGGEGESRLLAAAKGALTLAQLGMLETPESIPARRIAEAQVIELQDAIAEHEAGRG